jgi:broad specificity phosphatase PhoE
MKTRSFRTNTKGGFWNNTPKEKILRVDNKYYFTRHAFSCANLEKKLGTTRRITSFFNKEYDPSLTRYGIITTLLQNFVVTDEPALSEFKSKGIVYVSPLIRTWQTAILIYGSIECDVPLKLIISPFIKETGSTNDNMPLPIEKQLDKMNSFLQYLDNLKFIGDGQDDYSKTIRTKIRNILNENKLIEIHYEHQIYAFKPNGKTKSSSTLVQKFAVKSNKIPHTEPQQTFIPLDESIESVEIPNIRRWKYLSMYLKNYGASTFGLFNNWVIKHRHEHSKMLSDDLKQSIQPTKESDPMKSVNHVFVVAHSHIMKAMYKHLTTDKRDLPIFDQNVWTMAIEYFSFANNGRNSVTLYNGQDKPTSDQIKLMPNNDEMLCYGNTRVEDAPRLTPADIRRMRSERVQQPMVSPASPRIARILDNQWGMNKLEYESDPEESKSADVGGSIRRRGVTLRRKSTRPGSGRLYTRQKGRRYLKSASLGKN